MATIDVYSPFDMSNPTIYYGTVVEATATTIIISNDVDETIYSGNFGYNPDVLIDGQTEITGTLTGITEINDGFYSYVATGLSVNATVAEYYIQSGQPIPLLETALAGNDQFVVETAGTYVLDGYGGINTVVLPELFEQATISDAGASIIVTGPEISASLTSIQQIQFIDGTLTNGVWVPNVVPCFAAGTRILTNHGEVAVENLRLGDLVQTVLDDSLASIIWIGSRHVDCARHPKPKQVWPIRVATGAFGPELPHTDLWLSPDHSVYVNDVLIPIRHLVNGSSIVRVPLDNITYFHVELAEHNVVLAEGLPTESFLDLKDGSNYANRVRLCPDFTARMWEAYGCAPLIVAGPELETVRAIVYQKVAA
jgi:hypothetical protein